MDDIEEVIELPKGTRLFDLNDALAGGPVVDGYGAEITNLAVYQVEGEYCITGVQNLAGKRELRTYTREGRFDVNEQNCISNLCIKKIPTTMYVAAYRNIEGDGFILGNMYKTEDEAITASKRNTPDSFLKVIPVTIDM